MRTTPHGSRRRSFGLAPGRYRIALDAGDVSLTVADAAASGSLAPWRGELRASQAGVARAFVTLARGAAVTIERPFSWSGECGSSCPARGAFAQGTNSSRVALLTWTTPPSSTTKE